MPFLANWHVASCADERVRTTPVVDIILAAVRLIAIGDAETATDHDR
jgi:hypothetical protein